MDVPDATIPMISGCPTSGTIGAMWQRRSLTSPRSTPGSRRSFLPSIDEEWAIGPTSFASGATK